MTSSDHLRHWLALFCELVRRRPIGSLEKCRESLKRTSSVISSSVTDLLDADNGRQKFCCMRHWRPGKTNKGGGAGRYRLSFLVCRGRRHAVFIQGSQTIMMGGGIEGHSSCMREITLEVDGSRRRGFGRRTAIMNAIDSKSHGRPPTTQSQLEELSTGAQSGTSSIKRANNQYSVERADDQYLVQRRTNLRGISTGDMIHWQTPGVNQGNDNAELTGKKLTQ